MILGLEIAQLSIKRSLVSQKEPVMKSFVSLTIASVLLAANTLVAETVTVGPGGCFSASPVDRPGSGPFEVGGGLLQARQLKTTG